MNNQSRLKKYFVLLVLLAVPTLLFYGLLSTGVHKVKRLTFYGPRETIIKREKGQDIVDTIYYRVPEFSFIDIEGRNVNFNLFADKIIFVNFVDLSIVNYIPKEVIYFASDLLIFNKEPYFITFVLTEENQILTKPETQAFKGNEDRWYIVKGTQEELDYIWKEGFFKDDPYRGQADLFSIVLLDRQQRIRSYYNPILLTDIKAAQKELVLLQKEYELEFKTHKLIEFVD